MDALNTSRIAFLNAEQKKAFAEALHQLLNEKVSHGAEKPAKLVARVTSSDPLLNAEKIREFAKAKLADYMVPQDILLVEEVPRMANGKLDRQRLEGFAWQATETESDEDDYWQQEFVAPSNPVESLLAGIWGEVLGISEVSVNDDFFEVGGDSLLSIRILSRIHKAGFSLKADLFFEYPIISEQAKLLEKTGTVNISEGPLEGQFAVTPIQNWFFDYVNQGLEHWNQSVLLSLGEQFSFTDVQRSVQKLLLHHDVLRSHFVKEDDGWYQAFLPFSGELPLKRVDLAAKTQSERLQMIEGQAIEENKSLSLQGGDLIRFVWFNMPESSHNKLLIVVHHLLVDGESWQVLLDDLENLLQQSSGELDLSLALKTLSFKGWSAVLNEFTESESIHAVKSYWHQMANDSINARKALPALVSLDDVDNSYADNCIYTQIIEPVETQGLLHTINLQSEKSIRDVLLAAVTTALLRWSGLDEMVVDVEGHGRESLKEGADVSRSVGWFTSVFPVYVRNSNTNEPKEVYEQLKDTFTRMPLNGLGHGLLKYYCDDQKVKSIPRSQVCFNYLGNVDQKRTQDKIAADELHIDMENLGEVRGETCLRPYQIEINCKIQNQSFVIDWSYNDKLNSQSTMTTLANEFARILLSLCETSLSNERIPSESGNNEQDFDMAELDQSELDAIGNLLDQLDDD